MKQSNPLDLMSNELDLTIAYRELHFKKKIDNEQITTQAGTLGVEACLEKNISAQFHAACNEHHKDHRRSA